MLEKNNHENQKKRLTSSLMYKSGTSSVSYFISHLLQIFMVVIFLYPLELKNYIILIFYLIGSERNDYLSEETFVFELTIDLMRPF